MLPALDELYSMFSFGSCFTLMGKKIQCKMFNPDLRIQLKNINDIVQEITSKIFFVVSNRSSESFIFSTAMSLYLNGAFVQSRLFKSLLVMKE